MSLPVGQGKHHRYIQQDKVHPKEQKVGCNNFCPKQEKEEEEADEDKHVSRGRGGERRRQRSNRCLSCQIEVWLSHSPFLSPYLMTSMLCSAIQSFSRLILKTTNLKTVRRTVEVHVEINAVKERERDC
jgi:hypothetical protein